MANLKKGVTRKHSTPNFPKNEHFLSPDTHGAYQGVRNARISKIWRALFPFNTCFEIRPFALLPTNSRSGKHSRKVLKFFSEIYFVKLFELLASSRAQQRSSHSEVFQSLPKSTENYFLGCVHYTLWKFS